MNRNDSEKRRDLLKAGVALGGVAAVTGSLSGCHGKGAEDGKAAGSGGPAATAATQEKTVIATQPLGFIWPTLDPFLFCAYHKDAYPAGNEAMGPAASLDGRQLGSDFVVKDGWRMYHGQKVPGFPQHPHRGFETVTVARHGLVDHADSLGATARYGNGDVQWMTAGRGIVHAEMFPLLDKGAPNPLELFQVWLNLPAANKMVPPHFKMLWNNTIPRHQATDTAGRITKVTVIAGALADATAPTPPPNSWAAQAQSDVAIWTLELAAEAEFVLPAAQAGSNRMLYFFRGDALVVNGQRLTSHKAVQLRAAASTTLSAGATGCELLMLQGKPIGEPIARQGPFVMNTASEIRQAYQDYQRTRFGGWPWPDNAPVHERDAGRFAKYLDGTVERAT